jgi:hypothetical protein
MYRVVAVGAFALGFTACSQDIAGPSSVRRQADELAAGEYQHSTQTLGAEKEGNLSQCGWDALRKADGQLVDKKACKQ